MKKILLCLLLFLSVGCVANRIYDLREFPSYRLGIVQVDWLDSNWHIDVWINSQPNCRPDFTLLAGWQQEWEAKAETVSVYAEAWIWDRGKKLVVAQTKESIKIKISRVRDWNGYGWRVVLQSSDFAAL